MTAPAVERAYIEAFRHTIEVGRERGIEVLTDETDDADLTDAGRTIASARFHEVIEVYEAEERDRLAVLAEAARVEYEAQIVQGVARRRRRHFGRRTLERYPLTQPDDTCQRCGAIGGAPLELDHMMELVAGGPDHPHNLLRLCTRCHRAKPYLPHLATFVEWRLAVLTWALARPLVRWWTADELARYRRQVASVWAS